MRKRQREENHFCSECFLGFPTKHGLSTHLGMSTQCRVATILAAAEAAAPAGDRNAAAAAAAEPAQDAHQQPAPAPAPIAVGADADGEAPLPDAAYWSDGQGIEPDAEAAQPSSQPRSTLPVQSQPQPLDSSQHGEQQQQQTSDDDAAGAYASGCSVRNLGCMAADAAFGADVLADASDSDGSDNEADLAAEDSGAAQLLALEREEACPAPLNARERDAVALSVGLSRDQRRQLLAALRSELPLCFGTLADLDRCCEQRDDQVLPSTLTALCISQLSIPDSCKHYQTGPVFWQDGSRLPTAPAVSVCVPASCQIAGL